MREPRKQFRRTPTGWAAVRAAKPAEAEQVPAIVTRYHTMALNYARIHPQVIPGNLIASLAKVLVTALKADVAIFRADKAIYEEDFSFGLQRGEPTNRIVKRPEDIESLSKEIPRSLRSWRTLFGAHRNTTPYATLTVWRKNEFDLTEVAFLQLLSADIEHYIKLTLVYRFSATLKSTLTKTSEGVKCGVKLGTAMADLLHGLTRGLRADVGIYMTLTPPTYAIQYLALGQSRAHHTDVVVGQFRETMGLESLRTDGFLWTTGDALLPIGLSAMTSRAGVSLSTHRFVLIPITDSGELMGAFAFGYGPDRPNPSHENLEMLFRELPRTPRVLYQSLLQRSSNKMIVEPIYRGRDTRIAKDKCSVLMPLGAAWSDRIWNRVVKPCLIDLGFDPVRGDDLFGRDVMEDVWQMILSSEIVIADITNRNANVFYELGIAHCVGKDVILFNSVCGRYPLRSEPLSSHHL